MAATSGWPGNGATSALIEHPGNLVEIAADRRELRDRLREGQVFGFR
jgi:hypothetical protein